MAIGTAWEGFTTLLPNRPFDWGDMACYALSFGVFLAIAKRIDRKYQSPPQLLPIEIQPKR